MKKIRINQFKQYIEAIKDLQNNFSDIFESNISKNYFEQYITTKIKMYLYLSRQNKQLGVSLQIWLNAIAHKPSVYFFKEFPKIFLNKIGIGIYAK